MKFIPCIALVILLAGCKAPSYHFVSPTLNNTPYAQAGQGQLGVQFGSVGLGAKGGVAISDHVNLNAFFGGFPEANNGYASTESEFSLGFQTEPKNNGMASFYIGMGAGKNEKDKIGLSGNYNRPFVQAQWATYDKPIFSGKMYVDGGAGMRLNYLLYNGRLQANDFDENVFYMEPYLSFAIGGRNVRFEILQGITVKTSGAWARGVRIFPYFGNIGALFKLRKADK